MKILLQKSVNFEFFVTSRIMFDLFCASCRVSAGNIGYSDSFVLLGRGYIDRGVQTLLLSLPKKVLVTLIHFLCSFISVARRTNPEAPPQLSGLTVCRYGRCWGLRNSHLLGLSSPFYLRLSASSPPDKGGDFSRVFDSLSNPSVTACHLPYILLCKTQRRSGKVTLYSLQRCVPIWLRHTPVMLRGTTGWSFIFLFYYCV